MYQPLSEKEEGLAKQIVDAAFTVHKELGPGLLESIYEACFCYELQKRRLPFERQTPISVRYDNLTSPKGTAWMSLWRISSCAS